MGVCDTSRGDTCFRRGDECGKEDDARVRGQGRRRPCSRAGEATLVFEDRGGNATCPRAGEVVSRVRGQGRLCHVFEGREDNIKQTNMECRIKCKFLNEVSPE